jgi:arginine N-succinyltransferase
MFLIRPALENDLDEIFRLAQLSGAGMTSLPADKEILKEKIQSSIKSFSSEQILKSKGYYLFVMENLEAYHEKDSRLAGLSAIKAQVGVESPFYSYEIKEARHICRDLGIDKIVPFLLIHQENFGPSLIGTLFVDPAYRNLKLGKQISLVRFLYMADNLERFQNTVIAEMRGIIENNSSPFWEATIKHFIDLDYSKADYLSSIDKSFIADLMPKHPIYIPLLEKTVQDIIGKVHPETQRALDLLIDQGFERDKHVDIFDAGPRISAKTQSIKVVKNSFKIPIKNFESKKLHLISNSKSGIDFRSVLSSSEKISSLLNLNPEDMIRVYPL